MIRVAVVRQAGGVTHAVADVTREDRGCVRLHNFRDVDDQAPIVLHSGDSIEVDVEETGPVAAPDELADFRDGDLIDVDIERDA